MMLIWMVASASPMHVETPTAVLESVGTTAVTEAALARLARDGRFDAAKVGYEGRHSQNRKAWEHLSTLPTEDLEKLLQHEAVGVRYGALQALHLRGVLEPTKAMWHDVEPLTTCSGCRCHETTMAEFLTDKKLTLL